MYPQVDKNEQIPSAPPSYMESIGAQKYAYNPQHGNPSYPPAPEVASQVPTQVIVIQAPARKYFMFCVFVYSFHL